MEERGRPGHNRPQDARPAPGPLRTDGGPAPASDWPGHHPCLRRHLPPHPVARHGPDVASGVRDFRLRLLRRRVRNHAGRTDRQAPGLPATPRPKGDSPLASGKSTRRGRCGPGAASHRNRTPSCSLPNRSERESAGAARPDTQRPPPRNGRQPVDPNDKTQVNPSLVAFNKSQSGR